MELLLVSIAIIILKLLLNGTMAQNMAIPLLASNVVKRECMDLSMTDESLTLFASDNSN